MRERVILDDLERELHGRLRIDLTRVAAGEDSLYFYNSDHNPFDLPEARLSKRGSEAYQLARQVWRLRVDLGQPAICEASLLLQAVEHHADEGNQHRLGPKRLAAKLAADLERVNLK